MEEAKCFFLKHFTAVVDSDCAESTAELDVAHRIAFLLSLPYSPADFPESSLRPSDSTTWLDVKKEDLEMMLTGKLGEYSKYDLEKGEDVLEVGEDSDDAEEELNATNKNNNDETLPDEMIESMRSFVESISTHEGIEMNTINNSGGDTMNHEVEPEDAVSFDFNSFMDLLKGIDTVVEGDKPGSNNVLVEEEEMDIAKYMSEMDSELKSEATTMAKSFTQASSVLKPEGYNNTYEEDTKD